MSGNVYGWTRVLGNSALCVVHPPDYPHLSGHRDVTSVTEARKLVCERCRQGLYEVWVPRVTVQGERAGTTVYGWAGTGKEARQYLCLDDDPGPVDRLTMRPVTTALEALQRECTRCHRKLHTAAGLHHATQEPVVYWPFSGWDAKCVKCSAPGATARWQIGSDPVETLRDYLLRECRRCGYTWKEECADSGSYEAPAPEVLETNAAGEPIIVGDSLEDYLRKHLKAWADQVAGTLLAPSSASAEAAGSPETWGEFMDSLKRAADQEQITEVTPVVGYRHRKRGNIWCLEHRPRFVMDLYEAVTAAELPEGTKCNRWLTGGCCGKDLTAPQESPEPEPQEESVPVCDRHGDWTYSDAGRYRVCGRCFTGEDRPSAGWAPESAHD